jgi:hypothetical protein
MLNVQAGKQILILPLGNLKLSADPFFLQQCIRKLTNEPLKNGWKKFKKIIIKIKN